jgi:hypothetical protein
VGKVGKWALAVVLCVGCAKGSGDHVAGNVEPDGGVVVPQPPPPPPPPPDDGGQPDAGPPDAGPKFGGPGPWPIKNVEYGFADGIQEMPVVGVTTDETQNLWVATHSALYLLKPGETRFHRFDGSTGPADVHPDGIEHRLHLPGNPAAFCNDSAGLLTPCPAGDADTPGISEIVGGGPNEVFVGYFGHHDWGSATDGTEQDPWRHSGKLDRVRLQPDGNLEVVRFDMVSNNTVEFWHNRTVWKMVYDHGVNPKGHPHELYVGTDHGVDKISPDKWKPSVGWFLNPENQQSWMSDHLHPRACFHAVCVSDANQRLGDWRGLALDANGDLWVGGRWAAGQIKYTADNTNWYNNPRDPVTKESAFGPTFGDPYNGGCSDGDTTRPIFCPPQEGDVVNISAVAVDKNGVTWWSSGSIFNDPADVNYGIASFAPPGAPPPAVPWHFKYYDPIRDVGMAETNVRDMLALPDGRLVVAGPNTGLVIWDPQTGKHTSIRAGQGIPDDGVMRLQLDTMVDPPALQVATRGGAAVLRILP